LEEYDSNHETDSQENGGESSDDDDDDDQGSHQDSDQGSHQDSDQGSHQGSHQDSHISDSPPLTGETTLVHHRKGGMAGTGYANRMIDTAKIIQAQMKKRRME
jgi:hypothetical protein